MSSIKHINTHKEFPWRSPALFKYVILLSALLINFCWSQLHKAPDLRRFQQLLQIVIVIWIIQISDYSSCDSPNCFFPPSGNHALLPSGRRWQEVAYLQLEARLKKMNPPMPLQLPSERLQRTTRYCFLIFWKGLCRLISFYFGVNVWCQLAMLQCL